MKTKNRVIIAASIAALTLCAPLSSSAQEKKSTSAAQSSTTAVSTTAKSPRAIPFHGKVSAVDQAAKTISIPGKERMRIFSITETTVITKDGNPATMADIAADEEVRGLYWKRPDGSLETKSLKLGQKTEAEASKSKRKKKEKAESETMATPVPKP